MITNKGRVVYEREKHLMTEKDATRIMASMTKEQSPAELARTLWGIDVELVELRVLDETDLIIFAKEFILLVIKWIGTAQDWLWNLLSQWLIAPAAAAIPEEEEETND